MKQDKRASLVAQTVKNLPAVWETWVWYMGWEDPLRRAWQPTPVFLPGESPWTEEPGGLQSVGSQRVGHDWSNLAHTAQPWCAAFGVKSFLLFAYSFGVLFLHFSGEFDGCTYLPVVGGDSRDYDRHNCLGVYPEKIPIWKDTHTSKFIEELFINTIAKTW